MIKELDSATLKGLQKLDLSDEEQSEAEHKIRKEIEDFEVGDYRFIRVDAIDEILARELSLDSYLLGCFNAPFLADVTGWPIELIEAAQKGEQYEEIGEAILDKHFVDALAKAYASADGYGHHFAIYDGNEHEIGPHYYAFRID